MAKPSATFPRKSSTPSEDLPPYDEEAEAGALSCILTANGDGEAMLAELSLEDFYENRNRETFRGLQCLKADSKTLDCPTLYQWLRDKGRLEDAGGVDYVQNLPERSPTPA